MKIKIAAGVSILIYILLLLLINTNPVIVGYLCTVTFVVSFILLTIIFKDKPPKTDS